MKTITFYSYKGGDGDGAWRKGKILEDVRAALNQEASDLANTLTLEKPYSLCSDPALQIREFLTMDVSVSLDGLSDVPHFSLLTDYLDLLSRLASQETVKKCVAAYSGELGDYLEMKMSIIHALRRRLEHLPPVN
ncbi:MAG: hypothetical protein H7836_08460 [Magnetococcus sp. YQC-3]